jgi:hypothetical protein
MVNSPWCSAMCWGCHVVIRSACSAQYGPDNSAIAHIANVVYPHEPGVNSRTIHPIWMTVKANV